MEKLKKKAVPKLTKLSNLWKVGAKKRKRKGETRIVEKLKKAPQLLQGHILKVKVVTCKDEK